MKLIDKDALLAEIERLIERAKAERVLYPKTILSAKNYLLIEDYNKLLSFINTLEAKEVDFEKELDRMWFDNKLGDYFNNDALDFAHIRTLCKHFFELGLSVSNSTKVTIPDIDDVLKENGVNPDSKEAKIIKESYFMAIEKLTQKGE